jgi:hypothetical protein
MKSQQHPRSIGLPHCKRFDRYGKKKQFKNFELEIEIFKTNKPQAGLQKVPSYAVESSNHPLNLVRLSLKVRIMP